MHTCERDKGGGGGVCVWGGGGGGGIYPPVQKGFRFRKQVTVPSESCPTYCFSGLIGEERGREKRGMERRMREEGRREGRVREEGRREGRVREEGRREGRVREDRCRVKMDGG